MPGTLTAEEARALPDPGPRTPKVGEKYRLKRLQSVLWNVEGVLWWQRGEDNPFPMLELYAPELGRFLFDPADQAEALLMLPRNAKINYTPRR